MRTGLRRGPPIIWPIDVFAHAGTQHNIYLRIAKGHNSLSMQPVPDKSVKSHKQNLKLVTSESVNYVCTYTYSSRF